MKLLVTGGAGYIGSHVVRQLGEAGHNIVVYDNLSSGFEWAVLCGELVVGDLSDKKKLNSVFKENSFDAVLHFAALLVVPESVLKPLKYYGNNTRNTLNLLEVCDEHQIGNFVFSSTCSTYGVPDCHVLNEDVPQLPINPYGASKKMSERMIKDLAAASGLRYVILRYFNVAGADLELRIGQSTKNATHLIKVACEASRGERDSVTIFGTDYDTPDGTGIRDYIHVEDLAKAHVKALNYLARGGPSEVFNCGYGHGYSVREVINVVKDVSGVDFKVNEGERREGDPAALIADNKKIKKALGWRPDYDDLEVIVRTALNWEKRMDAF